MSIAATCTDRRLTPSDVTARPPRGAGLDGALGVSTRLSWHVPRRRSVADGLGSRRSLGPTRKAHFGNMLGSPPLPPPPPFASPLPPPFPPPPNESPREGTPPLLHRRGSPKARSTPAAAAMRPCSLCVAEAGLAGRSLEQLDPRACRLAAQAHIEQGYVLDRSGEKIGMVEAIMVTGLLVDHRPAQTMPARRMRAARMPARDVPLAKQIHENPAPVSPRSPASHVWTIGRMRLARTRPGIVPRRAEMQVHFRDTDTGYREKVRARVCSTSSRTPTGVPLPYRYRTNVQERAGTR